MASAGEPVVIASATIISPAEVSAQEATQLLFNPTPGVLRISVPGAAAPLELTASAVDGSAFSFTSASTSAAAMAALVQQLQSGAATGSLATPLSLSGVINGRGVQIVVLGAAQAGDGSGTLKATITFD